MQLFEVEYTEKYPRSNIIKTHTVVGDSADQVKMAFTRAYPEYYFINAKPTR